MMSNDDEKKPRRVNRKRKALNTARATNSASKIWSVCHNTGEDLWQALVIDSETKEVQCRGSLVRGQNPSYTSLNETMSRDFERMVEEDEESK